MKLFFFLLVMITSCNRHSAAEIKFNSTSKKFKLTKGEKFVTEFEFINSGNDSLKIKSIHASCGCTVAHYPKYSIAPGHKDKIRVTYDSNVGGIEGIVRNDVLVESNTIPILSRLSIEAEIRSSILNR